MKRIYLYGQFRGHMSFPTVTRGLFAGLRALGLDPVCATPKSPEDMWEYTSDGWQKADSVEWNAEPDLSCPALYFGYPPLAPDYFWRHRVKVGYFIAESCKIPLTWSFFSRQCNLLLFPSHWVATAYQRSEAPPDRIMVVPHGIHPIFDCKAPSGTSLLHISGSRDFIHRKGTKELIQACKILGLPLTVRTPYTEHIAKAIDEGGATADFNSEGLSPEGMRDLYCRGWRAVVQPSRAEAFGLVPVEARAMGIPVLLTDGHGHLEHVTPRDTLVGLGPLEYKPAQGIYDAVMPGLDIDKLVLALRELSTRTEPNLAAYRESWRWDRVLSQRRLLDTLTADAPRTRVA
jgi:glycosyltransferase involved in cell wall biosynthesis